MNRRFLGMLIVLALLVAPALVMGESDLPRVAAQDGVSRLLVHGKPFLIRGGELGNSSAGTAAQADEILPKLAQMHLNTVLMPVAWEQIEPEEGKFDYSILDHWMDVARTQNLHLVLLWFGSWKNAYSEYAPAWVKADTKRFPREISADGSPTEVLSPLGAETQSADSRAFAALMRHVRKRDTAQQTVLMVQVENEIGFLGTGGRDRSDAANRLFSGAVPDQLMRSLESRRAPLSSELAAHFNPAGHTWREAFGDAAGEVFMAWYYGRFVDAVAAAGKSEYALPMYMNAQLPAPLERAGDYPSGGPHPYYQDVYRVAAPAIDFYAPDIYWPNFEYWVERYRAAGNPVFVPEARLAGGQYNALYVYGEALGFGFSPFAVESAQEPVDAGARPSLGEVDATIENLNDDILEAQAGREIRALVLHASSARPTQTVALGGYLFDATLSRSWPARSLETDDGAMLVIQKDRDEFLMAGSGLTVTITRDPDTDNRVAGITGIEQLRWTDGKWLIEKRLNGDQSNQGRQLQMDPHVIRVFRVNLYSYLREEHR